MREGRQSVSSRSARPCKTRPDAMTSYYERLILRQRNSGFEAADPGEPLGEFQAVRSATRLHFALTFLPVGTTRASKQVNAARFRGSAPGQCLAPAARRSFSARLSVHLFQESFKRPQLENGNRTSWSRLAATFCYTETVVNRQLRRYTRTHRCASSEGGNWDDLFVSKDSFQGLSKACSGLVLDVPEGRPRQAIVAVLSCQSRERSSRKRKSLSSSEQW